MVGVVGSSPIAPTNSCSGRPGASVRRPGPGDPRIGPGSRLRPLPSRSLPATAVAAVARRSLRQVSGGKLRRVRSRAPPRERPCVLCRRASRARGAPRHRESALARSSRSTVRFTLRSAAIQAGILIVEPLYNWARSCGQDSSITLIRLQFKKQMEIGIVAKHAKKHR